MHDLLLLPEGWPRWLVLVVCAGILGLLRLRRSWLATLEEPASENPETHPAAAGPEGIARSLFIVARNEAERLPGLLQDLEALLDEDQELEIVLGDDHSTDATRRLLDEFCASQPRARVLDAGSEHGKAAWLRRAVPQARGSLLLFSDADCRLPRRWSLALDEVLATEALVAGGGPVLLTRETTTNSAARWQRLHWLLLSGVAAALSRRSAAKGQPGAPSLWGGNLALRREALDTLGGYAACCTGQRNEDLELARRLTRAGLPLGLRLSPRALRVRTHPVSWSGCARQQARWASGCCRLSTLHALLILAPIIWLAALLTILWLKPLLGLLLVFTAAQSLSVLLSGLAALVEDEGASLLDSAFYLAALPLLTLAALASVLRGGLSQGSRG
jgi:cellulose synthase/poly-beta-1,6-N-acetylglucosamine synthase-like glycosyltransferase